ncbi:SO_0444 family Cu/Zn efflux transporter [Magnetococcales bacterium HHB-1]
MFIDLLTNTWHIILESAPWLILGFIVAGLMKAWVPADRMQQWLGKPGPGSVIRAALIGAPLPLCSCGVIPAALGLRRAGASKGATTSFLISTPETGVDSMAISYALLGPFMAIVRPIAALFSAILAGLLVDRFADAPEKALKKAPVQSIPIRSMPPIAIKAQNREPCEDQCGCDTDKKPTIIPIAAPITFRKPDHEPCEDQCGCDTNKKPTIIPIAAPITSCKPDDKSSSQCGCDTQEETPSPPGFLTKTKSGILYAFTNILDGIVFWLGLGLLLAGVVTTLVPPQMLAEWGSGLSAMLMMILVGIPMYICATASTPVAAALLFAGVSPGATLVFLLAGPATNMATLAVVGREMGRKALIGYLSGIVIGSLSFGFLVDSIVHATDIPIVEQLADQHETIPLWISISAVIILVTCAIRPLRDWLFRQTGLSSRQ